MQLAQHARTRRLRLLTAAVTPVLLAVLAAFGSSSAAAASDESSASSSTSVAGNADLSVTKLDFSDFPTIRIAFTLDSEDRQLPSFEIDENGKHITNINAYTGKLGRYESNPKPVIMLALDTSDSMRPPKIDNAKQAALRLIDQARPGDRIGLVGFGKVAQVLQVPTDDLDLVREQVSRVVLTHGTALYDGVDEAIDAFPSDASRRIVVVLSDGADLGSTSTQEQVTKAANRTGTEIFAVALTGPGYSPVSLRNMSQSSGGQLQEVSNPGQLDAMFATLGQQLLRGYWLEYNSSQPGSTAIKVTIKPSGFEPATYSYTTPLAKRSDGSIIVKRPPTVKNVEPAINLPNGAAGVAIAAIPFGLLTTFLIWIFLQRRSRPNFTARLEPYTRREQAVLHPKAALNRRDTLLQPLYKLTESVLGTSSLFKRFHFLIEQSNLPLRPVELLYMMIAGLAIGLAFALLFFGTMIAVGMFTVIGFAMPYLWVRHKARRRKKRFEDQLADMLGTVAASLKAGHSFNGSLNAVIKEAPSPTRDELQRVMTEARLGLPVEESLESMALRMDSTDFEFAVTTVNIQRTVGGSLSEILEMVSDTVRNRQQFRKKVKALTSMGSLSAYVLLGMPIFMAGVLSLLNREYMQPLFFTTTGHYLMAAGAFFMFLGYVACMKIVRIKT